MDFYKKITLGTAQIGLDYGINNSQGKKSKVQNLKILKTAYEKGVRNLDTAEIYGNSHNIIGDFHNKYSDYLFNVNTKISNLKNLPLKDLVNNYLDTMNIKFLDCLMFHNYNIYKKYSNKIPQLIDLKKKGLINNIGVSVYSNSEIVNVSNYY